MKNLRKLTLLGILTTSLVMTACGSSSSSSANYLSPMEAGGAKEDYSYDSGDIYESASEDYAMEDSASYDNGETGTVDAQAENVASNRKLIKRVELSVETQEFDSLTSKIEARIAELGGYIEDSSINGNTYNGTSSRSANYTARIPAKKLDQFVTSVSEVSNVTNKSESAKDVTLEYVDTQSRKEALKVEQERMMELLEKAEDLETIIGLEQRLTNIRYELQSYESQIRTYDNLVDYATVNINVREVKIYTPVDTPEKSDWDRMCEGFVASLVDVGNGIKNFFIGLVIILPYLVIWGAIIGAIVFFVIKKAKNSEKARAKKEAKAKAKEEKAEARAKAKREAAEKRAGTWKPDNTNDEKVETSQENTSKEDKKES